MSYYQTPELYQQLLGHVGLLEEIYEAMDYGDVTELAVIALDVLKNTKTLPTFKREQKSDEASNKFREEGNKAYGDSKYKMALECYNKALLSALPGSRPMLLAYSNRSALLYQTKNYSACLNDIETCFFKFDCPKEITAKLRKRRDDCQQHLWREKADYVQFSRDFFKFDVPRNPDIPSVSTDVKVIFDKVTNVPKVVAANDIKVGTVVGVETAFAGIINPINHYVSCYYCHRLNLNLIPCAVCCYALFCDNICKQKCMDETHKFECHIMEALHSNVFGPYSRITLRTVLKIKLLCESWDEFIEASYYVGTERLEISTINEIYDVNQKFSMLCYLNLRDIKNGSLYNFGFMCGTLLHQLMNIPNFFPAEEQEDERFEAIDACSRMMMQLFLTFANKIVVHNTANDYMMQQIKHMAPNYGYFSFASKLNHACDANLLAIGLNNKLGLLALQPIKKGAELTISYIDHAYDHMHEPETTRNARIVELYRLYRICHCPACDCTWKFNHRKLTVEQKKFYKKWTSSISDTCVLQLMLGSKDQGEDSFKKTCEGLTVLHGMSHRPEHRQMYVIFRNLVSVYQYLATKNACPEDFGTNTKMLSFLKL